MNIELDKIKKAFENVGIYTEGIDETNKLKEYLVDSLTFISFFVEIENIYDIEIPDNFYNQDTLEMSIGNLIKIISKCKGGETEL